MAREMYDIKPKIYPTPPLLKDYEGMHKGWGTVVGYSGKVPQKLTSTGKKPQNRRLHRWVCHCSKCNRYFKTSHQFLGTIFKPGSDREFMCHSCKGKILYKK